MLCCFTQSRQEGMLRSCHLSKIKSGIMPVSEDRKFWAEDNVCTRVLRRIHSVFKNLYYHSTQSHFTDEEVEAKVKKVDCL